jgi:sugar O-acyltransferase (sialic acid O-acetyltransferase NeuD family)
MKENLIIYGSSGHAKVVIDVFERENKYNIVGLMVSLNENGENIFGYKNIGDEHDLPELMKKYKGLKIFIAIGDNWVRHLIKDKISQIVPDIEFASAVHPSANIGKNVKIGNGTVIMPGVTVNCNSVIGDFTILNTNSSLDHDCVMHDFSSMAPNATTGGYVSIGAYSAVSIGATVTHKVSIGEHSIIGAGGVLLKNCGNNMIMYGVPARFIRRREIGEEYL